MSTNHVFIGCEKWVKKETGHTCILLQHYDPIAVIQRWGKERVVIHDDIIESLSLWNGSILQQLLYLVYSLLISLTVESPIPKCYAVYANIQGSKNQQCPFYHRVIDSNQRKKGKIVQLECQCIFHYYFPHIINDKPSSK